MLRIVTREAPTLLRCPRHSIVHHLLPFSQASRWWVVHHLHEEIEHRSHVHWSCLSSNHRTNSIKRLTCLSFPWSHEECGDDQWKLVIHKYTVKKSNRNHRQKNGETRLWSQWLTSILFEKVTQFLFFWHGGGWPPQPLPLLSKFLFVTSGTQVKVAGSATVRDVVWTLPNGKGEVSLKWKQVGSSRFIQHNSTICKQTMYSPITHSKIFWERGVRFIKGSHQLVCKRVFAKHHNMGNGHTTGTASYLHKFSMMHGEGESGQGPSFDHCKCHTHGTWGRSRRRGGACECAEST